MLSNYLAPWRRVNVAIIGFGVLAVAGVLAAVLGNGLLRVVATVGAIVFVAAAVFILLVERRGLQRVLDVRSQLVTRYSDLAADQRIAARAVPLISVENWHQKVHIQPNGDVREVVVVEAVALRDEVYFIRFHLGSEWEQPEKYRKNVTVNADIIEIDGKSSTRWSITNTWLSDAKLMSIVHFHSPVRIGQDIRIEMTRFWPAKCLPLMRHGASEQFVFRTTELLQLRRLEYQVILPAGFDAMFEPVGFTPPNSRVSVAGYSDIEGRRVFICRATELPERRTVGMRLSLV